MSAAVDPQRVISDLRALAERTGDESGAQRLCWTPVWRDARAFLGELLEEIGVGHEIDEAGNLWARIDGADRDAPALVLGSHIDSVPEGGWLDGALGVMAALGVLRAWRESGDVPSRDVVLVDWADEEGARFGRSLFGSSAFAGTLDIETVRALEDADGVGLPEALAENGVELDRVAEAADRRQGLGAYLELHIEQGPVMEAEGSPVAAVEGCVGIERLSFVFSGQASHAGTTPMDRRHDAGLAAAAAALEIERIPDRHGGVATTGSLQLQPGIVTAVAGRARLSCDLRNADASALEEMLEAARSAAGSAAKHRGCEVREELIWRIAPTPFDHNLVGHASAVAAELGGRETPITSGALHDAAEVARVIPAAMLFVPSIGGLSHTHEEDTSDSDLARGIDCVRAEQPSGCSGCNGPGGSATLVGRPGGEPPGEPTDEGARRARPRDPDQQADRDVRVQRDRLLGPEGDVHQLHAEEEARGLQHAGPDGHLDGDHAAQRRRGRLDPRDRPRHRHRRLARHDRARLGPGRLARHLRAGQGGRHPRDRHADLARREVVGRDPDHRAPLRPLGDLSTTTASTRTTAGSAAASSPATRTASSTAR